MCVHMYAWRFIIVTLISLNKGHVDNFPCNMLKPNFLSDLKEIHGANSWQWCKRWTPVCCLWIGSGNFWDVPVFPWEVTKIAINIRTSYGTCFKLLRHKIYRSLECVSYCWPDTTEIYACFHEKSQFSAWIYKMYVRVQMLSYEVSFFWSLLTPVALARKLNQETVTCLWFLIHPFDF